MKTVHVKGTMPDWMDSKLREAKAEAEASERTRMVVTDISDFRAVVQHYREDARVWQALIAIAQQDIERGQTVPGVTVEEK